MRGTFFTFTKSIISTRLQDEILRRRAVVLNVLLITTSGILFVAFGILAVSFIRGDHTVVARLLAISSVLAMTALLYLLSRKLQYHISAYGLLAIYLLIATTAAVHSGANLPVAELLYGFIIILAGELLGAKYSLYALFFVCVLIYGIQYLTITGNLQPNLTWRHIAPALSDVWSYFFVFILTAVIAWLYNRQMEIALKKALRAEASVTRQKKLLEKKVEERTRELQAAQIEKMQQLYRFAQLGQFSTGLLHDLANHLTTLSIDIEGMGEEHHSQFVSRAQRRIQYIDKMVQWAYEHLNGRVQAKSFSIPHEINEVITLLQHEANLAQVHLRFESDEADETTYYGDPNRFRQVMANLITNAIDAYEGNGMYKKRDVVVQVFKNADSLLILVNDWGKGIASDKQQSIFEPFYSTKNSGMGIGLFIVKQIIEDYFNGSIAVASEVGQTTFSVTLRKTAVPT